MFKKSYNQKILLLGGSDNKKSGETYFESFQDNKKSSETLYESAMSNHSDNIKISDSPLLKNDTPSFKDYGILQSHSQSNLDRITEHNSEDKYHDFSPNTKFNRNRLIDVMEYQEFEEQIENNSNLNHRQQQQYQNNQHSHPSELVQKSSDTENYLESVQVTRDFFQIKDYKSAEYDIKKEYNTTQSDLARLDDLMFQSQNQEQLKVNLDPNSKSKNDFNSGEVESPTKELHKVNFANINDNTVTRNSSLFKSFNINEEFEKSQDLVTQDENAFVNNVSVFYEIKDTAELKKQLSELKDKLKFEYNYRLQNIQNEMRKEFELKCRTTFEDQKVYLQSEMLNRIEEHKEVLEKQLDDKYLILISQIRENYESQIQYYTSDEYQKKRTEHLWEEDRVKLEIEYKNKVKYLESEFQQKLMELEASFERQRTVEADLLYKNMKQKYEEELRKDLTDLDAQKEEMHYRMQEQEAAFLKDLKERKDQIKLDAIEEFKTTISENFSKELKNSIKDQVVEDIKEEYYHQVYNDLSNNIYEDLKAQKYKEIHMSIKENLESEYSNIKQQMKNDYEYRMEIFKKEQEKLYQEKAEALISQEVLHKEREFKKMMLANLENYKTKVRHDVESEVQDHLKKSNHEINLRKAEVARKRSQTNVLKSSVEKKYLDKERQLSDLQSRLECRERQLEAERRKVNGMAKEYERRLMAFQKDNKLSNADMIANDHGIMGKLAQLNDHETQLVSVNESTIKGNDSSLDLLHAQDSKGSKDLDLYESSIKFASFKGNTGNTELKTNEFVKTDDKLNHTENTNKSSNKHSKQNGNIIEYHQYSDREDSHNYISKLNLHLKQQKEQRESESKSKDHFLNKNTSKLNPSTSTTSTISKNNAINNKQKDLEEKKSGKYPFYQDKDIINGVKEKKTLGPRDELLYKTEPGKTLGSNMEKTNTSFRTTQESVSSPIRQNDFNKVVNISKSRSKKDGMSTERSKTDRSNVKTYDNNYFNSLFTVDSKGPSPKNEHFEEYISSIANSRIFKELISKSRNENTDGLIDKQNTNPTSLGGTERNIKDIGTNYIDKENSKNNMTFDARFKNYIDKFDNKYIMRSHTPHNDFSKEIKEMKSEYIQCHEDFSDQLRKGSPHPQAWNERRNLGTESQVFEKAWEGKTFKSTNLEEALHEYRSKLKY